MVVFARPVFGDGRKETGVTGFCTFVTLAMEETQQPCV